MYEKNDNRIMQIDFIELIKKYLKKKIVFQKFQRILLKTILNE